MKTRLLESKKEPSYDHIPTVRDREAGVRTCCAIPAPSWLGITSLDRFPTWGCFLNTGQKRNIGDGIVTVLEKKRRRGIHC